MSRTAAVMQATATRNVFAVLQRWLSTRLTPEGHAFLQSALDEIGAGVTVRRYAELISLASRYARRSQALTPRPAEKLVAHALIAGWNPERWSLPETLRIALILSWPDLSSESFVVAFEQCFRYADEGELRALYRALALLPDGERFVWRAGEGCRSNMRTVFEAVVCDSPYPVTHFDDRAWHQLVIKSVFIDAPLWRVYGLDTRLSLELARIALDMVDERRSAGRPVQPQLWLCLGRHGGERALHALHQEITTGESLGKRAALLALARAGELARVQTWLGNELSELRSTYNQARAGDFAQDAFGRL